MGERWGEAGKKNKGKRENDAKIVEGGKARPRGVKGKQTPQEKEEFRGRKKYGK